MILTSQGYETKSHVLFLVRMSNSDCMVDFQLGSDKAKVGFLGRVDIIGSTMEIKRLKILLGL